jgi:hypothetical protein
MRKLSFLLLTVATSLAAACGTSLTYHPTNRAPRAMTPRPFDTVEVYTVSLPQRPFVEVGILEAQQESELSLDAPPEVLVKLRQRAAAQGCDAIIMNGANDSVVGHGDRRHSHVTTLRGYRATCIMFSDAQLGAR